MADGSRAGPIDDGRYDGDITPAGPSCQRSYGRTTRWMVSVGDHGPRECIPATRGGNRPERGRSGLFPRQPVGHNGGGFRSRSRPTPPSSESERTADCPCCSLPASAIPTSGVGVRSPSPPLIYSPDKSSSTVSRAGPRSRPFLPLARESSTVLAMATSAGVESQPRAANLHVSRICG